ncbi:ankyrin repeat-containing domain protein, partial [Parachaetomium inaequale]
LTCAVTFSRAAVIHRLLRDPIPEFEQKDGRGWTAIFEACARGSAEIAELLLRLLPFELNAFDVEGYSPLLHAIRGNHEAVVQVLVGHKTIDLNLLDPAGRTPIFVALQMRNANIIRSLLGTGRIDLRVEDPQGNTPALRAIQTRVYHADIMKTILAGSDLRWDSGLASWPEVFQAAIAYDNPAAVQFCIATGRIDLNRRLIPDGLTPLEFAVHFRSSDVVKPLIEAGADATLKDVEGNSPLFKAIGSDDMETAHQLLWAEPRLPRFKNGRGETPLQFVTRLKSSTHPMALTLRFLESANERERQGHRGELIPGKARFMHSST